MKIITIYIKIFCVMGIDKTVEYILQFVKHKLHL